jgi:phospholipase/carboxylesterase
VFTHKFIAGTNGQTVLALHGTGGTENDLISLAQSLFPEANVLAPRGNVTERGMARFFKRFAEGVFDVENLKAETLKLANFVLDSSQKYNFNADRVWGMGFSNGANIAASLLLERPEILSGAILLRAMTPFEPENLPDLNGKPIYIASGQYDPIVPVNDVSRLADIFRDTGANVKHQFVAGDHGLVSHEIESLKSWLGEINH